MGLLNKIELMKDLIQNAIDNGARTVEDVHKAIADLPFEVLEKSGLLDDDAQHTRQRHQQTIGAVYATIRDVNQRVGELASNMFESIEDGQHISRVMDKQTPPAKSDDDR